MSVETMFEFSTTDPDVGHACLNDIYGGERPLQFSGDPNGFEFSMRAVNVGQLGSDEIRYSMSAAVSMAPPLIFVGLSVVGGRFDDFGLAGSERRFRKGDVVCYGRDAEITCAWTDMDALNLRVPFDVIDRIASEQLGVEGPVRFEESAAISNAATHQWRTLTQFISRESRSPDSLLSSPLIQAETIELVAATALTVFPNSAMGAPMAGPRCYPRPAAIRRAMLFIEDHAAEPLTITDIAAAAGVTPRALQYGFARHLEMTPMSYLRRIRLEHAHRDLEVADPATGATVQQIARRWGFSRPSRFAAAYCALYGQSPAHTLRT
jgi:AraC-like DNA-binding protein